MSFGKVVAVSSFYETEPVEVTTQPWFLNCVVAMESDLPGRALLNALLEIERSMGRVRTQTKGPRIIDLDILLYGEDVVEEPGLTIPHPALAERRFVLEPFAEIAPGVVHPTLHKTIGQLREDLPPGQEVKKILSSDSRPDLA